jgi:hypothetical protein
MTDHNCIIADQDFLDQKAHDPLSLARSETVLRGCAWAGGGRALANACPMVPARPVARPGRLQRAAIMVRLGGAG